MSAVQRGTMRKNDSPGTQRSRHAGSAALRTAASFVSGGGELRIKPAKDGNQRAAGAERKLEPTCAEDPPCRHVDELLHDGAQAPRRFARWRGGTSGPRRQLWPSQRRILKAS